MAAIQSFTGGLRAKPGAYWARRPSQRSNFSMGRRFSADVHFQNSVYAILHNFNNFTPYYNWNFHPPPKKMDQHSSFQEPYTPFMPSRSFEDLHHERTYLLSSLQYEDHKATELLKRLSSIEVSLQNPSSRTSHRKVKRQLAWLRHRLGETTEQEKSILARLGQLSWEIQSRERMVQIECERIEMERLMVGQSSSWHASHSGLDPRNSNFQPAVQHVWPPQQQYFAGGYFGQYQPSTVFEPISYQQPGNAFFSQLSFELPADELVKKKQENLEPALKISSRSNSLTVWELPRNSAQNKRLSLPTLSNDWERTGKSDGEERQYVGYYVKGT